MGHENTAHERPFSRDAERSAERGPTPNSAPVRTPAISRVTGCRTSRRIDQRIVNHDTTTPVNQPISTLSHDTCNARKGVEMAASHQVRRPKTINQAWNTPRATPAVAPTAATMIPSRASSRVIRRRPIPTAASVPSSLARCSMPNWNNSATSITAAAIRKKLKPINRASNGVVPADAARPCVFTGRNVMPSDDGTISRRSRSATFPG